MICLKTDIGPFTPGQIRLAVMEMTTMRELIRELIKHGMDDMTIRSVFLGLDTEEQCKQLADWLQTVKNPTKDDIMVKTYLITEEE